MKDKILTLNDHPLIYWYCKCIICIGYIFLGYSGAMVLEINSL